MGALPEAPGKRIESVKGGLVEAPPAGVLHDPIAAPLYRLLHIFIQGGNVGLVFTDGLGAIIGRRPDPDVSFVAGDQIAAEDLPSGCRDLTPALAVDSVSPNDTAGGLHAKACLRARRKVRAYLAPGTRPVWVVRPDGRSVIAYAAGGGYREHGPDDEIDGGEVLPSCRVRTAGLFDVDPVAWPDPAPIAGDRHLSQRRLPAGGEAGWWEAVVWLRRCARSSGAWKRRAGLFTARRVHTASTPTRRSQDG